MGTHRPPLEPLPPSPSQYGIGAEIPMRAKDLPDMGSMRNVDLFPEGLSPVIFPGKNGLKGIREATEASLENVDMSMIKPHDSVNILASHHSFLLLGGDPYAEMVRTIKDIVQKRTGVKDIRFLGGVGLRFRESEEQISMKADGFSLAIDLAQNPDRQAAVQKLQEAIDRLQGPGSSS